MCSNRKLNGGHNPENIVWRLMGQEKSYKALRYGEVEALIELQVDELFTIFREIFSNILLPLYNV